MAVTHIMKRDGTIVPFDRKRIENAMYAAARAVGNGEGRPWAETLSWAVVALLDERVNGTDRIPHVEEIQDIVEEVLVKSGNPKVAKAYILYRQKRAEARATERMLLDAEKLVEDYLQRADWRVNENSNMNYSLQGLNFYLASSIAARYWLQKVYPPEVQQAHLTGDVHIHDLGMLSTYCCGWDLLDLLEQGFGGVPAKIESRPPRHLRTALGQLVNFFYTLQGESAGAVAVSNFDTLMAPFVRHDGLDYTQVKQAVQEFIFNINVPTRVGFQCLSEDTEILTPAGWKGYDEIEVGDLIKTFNIQTGIIETQPVLKMFARPYNGPMYRLRNRIQDQLISPGHRVVRKKFNTDNVFVLEPVEDVRAYKSPVIVPLIGTNCNPPKAISDDEIRLLAWIIAEGSKESYTKHRHSHRISIYQSRIASPESYAEIIGLLERLHLDYNVRDSTPALGESVQMIRLTAESSHRILDTLFQTRENIKFVPDILKNMDRRQARLFLDTYLKADGHEGCKITTSDIEILDGLQQIAVDAEYAFTVGMRQPTIGKKPLYILRLIDHRDTYIQKIEVIDYSGVIWCPTTENQTVIARRNGKVFVTGNTPFTNVTMDLTAPPTLADEPVIIGGEMQSATYGEFQQEMDMLNRAFAEVMLEGDAKGRVFSVDYASYTPIRENGKISLVQIGKYIDAKMAAATPMRIAENQAEVLDVQGFDIQTIGIHQGRVGWQPVQYLVRHPEERLLKITTVGGFNVSVTPSHSVLTLCNGEIVACEARRLKPGDYLLAPKTLDLGQTTISEISLAHTFAQTDPEGIYLHGARYRDGRPLYEIRTAHGQKAYNYKVTPVPLAHVLDKLDELDLSEARIGLRGSDILIPNTIQVNASLLEFLGYYVAEDSAERGRYGGISLGFNLTKERDVANRLATWLSGTFAEATVREIPERNLIEIRVHSKLLRRMMRDVFGIANGVERQVPSLVFGMPDELKRAFLRGYLQGDAYKRQNSLSASTIAPGVAYGVSTLLKEIGVAHTLTEYVRRDSGRKVYRINLWSTDLSERTHHTIGKIPIGASGIGTLFEAMLEREPEYRDALGRKYRNSLNRLMSRYGVARQESTSIENARRIVTDAEHMGIPVPQSLNWLLEANIVFLRIKTIEEQPTTTGMVYDFSTRSESFLANQILVHNTFPIPTYNISKDFHWDNPDLAPIWAMTAKYGIPYFANFINSDMKPEDARSMCLFPTETMLVRENGVIRKTTIGELFASCSDRCIDGAWFTVNRKVEALSLNSDTGHVEWTPVIRFLRVSDRELVTIRTRDGKTMRVSSNHLVAVFTEEGIRTKKAKDVVKEDLLLVLKDGSSALGEGTPLDPDLAWFMGFFVADGNYLYDTRYAEKRLRGVQFSFDARNQNLPEKVRTLVKKFADYDMKFTQDPRYPNSLRGYVFSRSFANLLSEEYDVRKYGGLPGWIWSASPAVIETFLQGFFDGDGYQDGKEIHINDAELARELNLLMQLVGISTTYSVHERSQTIRIQHTLGRAASGRKVIKDTLHNMVPQFLMDKKHVKDEHKRTRYQAYGCKMVGLSSIDRWGLSNEKIERLRNAAFAVVPIADLQRETLAGEQVFYDVELENNHYFVHSDGNITHNCCRLRLDNRELRKRVGGLFAAAPLTGSVGVVTLNMARLGYLARDEQDFRERLERLMETARTSLEIKRKMLETFTERGLYPYSYYFLRTVKARSGKFWSNHFSTIGLNGMHEASLNLFGVGIDHPDGHAFAIRTLHFMRDVLMRFQEETGHLYNLEATPAEGASYRLARADKERYPDIKTSGTEVAPYYTNSTQLPVDFSDDLFEVLDHQDELQTLYTGGTVLHIFLGEQLDSWQQARRLVRTVAENYRLPYYTLTPTFSICPVHGYIPGAHSYCPYEHTEEQLKRFGRPVTRE